MHRLKQLNSYKKHLKERYITLVEESNSYQYEDESMSDIAAFKGYEITWKNKSSSLFRQKIDCLIR